MLGSRKEYKAGKLTASIRSPTGIGGRLLIIGETRSKLAKWWNEDKGGRKFDRLLRLFVVA
jgi:hypothetical protein